MSFYNAFGENTYFTRTKVIEKFHLVLSERKGPRSPVTFKQLGERALR